MSEANTRGKPKTVRFASEPAQASTQPYEQALTFPRRAYSHRRLTLAEFVQVAVADSISIHYRTRINRKVIRQQVPASLFLGKGREGEEMALY